MKTIKIYHNPRCSKSREALKILTDRGLDIEVIEYLKNPPSYAALKKIAEKLGDEKESLFRTKEAEYRTIAGLSFDARLKQVAEMPSLLERPIVVIGDKAVVARSAEKLLDILD